MTGMGMDGLGNGGKVGKREVEGGDIHDHEHDKYDGVA